LVKVRGLLRCDNWACARGGLFVDRDANAADNIGAAFEAADRGVAKPPHLRAACDDETRDGRPPRAAGHRLEPRSPEAAGRAGRPGHGSRALAARARCARAATAARAAADFSNKSASALGVGMPSRANPCATATSPRGVPYSPFPHCGKL
jgi:hypothetical protein